MEHGAKTGMDNFTGFFLSLSLPSPHPQSFSPPVAGNVFFLYFFHRGACSAKRERSAVEEQGEGSCGLLPNMGILYSFY